MLASAVDYQNFWCRTAEKMLNVNDTFGTVTFLHKSDKGDSRLSRFRSVDTDSLLRPLHILEIILTNATPLLHDAYEAALSMCSKGQDSLRACSLLEDSVNIRFYNNCIAILQMDLDISRYIETVDEKDLPRSLDTLQAFGVALGEHLAQLAYSRYIKQYLEKLLSTCDGADRFISRRYFDFEVAAAASILTEGSSVENQVVKVNWVTRTLLLESSDIHSNYIVEHWLKDSGDQKLIDKVKNGSDEYAMRWLNYLFRENAYAWTRNKSGDIDYSTPFADEWQAMLNAQYYYSTFEALNDSLTATLANTYRVPEGGRMHTTGAFRELSRRLEHDIKVANMATMEYHNNYGYYKRLISNVMKEIMAGWDFEEAILDEVERKVILCERRLDELHKKAESRSGFYSDLLLLGIALISVSAFLFQLIAYGRNMSHDADLAMYESNSWNLVQFIAERPTDFVITLSLALIVILFVLYAWFRRLKVMD